VTVPVLAALLVSATALAQTPPASTSSPTPPATTPSGSTSQSGAPLAEPKLRTDADIQREIDARVEAAKKELREEMRAQAATAAATAPTPSFDVEATTHRKLDLIEPHGYFRVRPELFQKFDLDQPPDRSGYRLFPRPDDNGHTIAGVNMRFRFEPTLNISEEVRIKSQIDMLDDLVWGSTPQYAYIRQNRIDLGITNTTQVPPVPGVNSTQSNLAVKRVWGEVATPLGLLRFGRMGDQFGLGIVHNDGNCLDCDYGVTVDRFQFVAEPLPGFFIVPTLDFDIEGLVSGGTISPGQPYDVTQSDDAHTFGIVIARKDTDQKARVKLDAGGTIVNYGLYFQYRSQRNEYNQNGTTFTQEDPYQTLQTEFRFLDGALKIGGELGVASGDSAPGFGNKPNRPTNQTFQTLKPVGAQWGDYEGAQYGKRFCSPTSNNTCIDLDIRNFRFNQDYRIDMILWREIIGGITDALYVRLPASYNFNDNISVFGAMIYSKALKPSSTPSGTSTQLGFEVDAGVRYQTDDGFYAQFSYGVLFPFAGLQNNYLNSYFATPIGPGVAQAIRCQLGIRF